jgi:hypothetical protein
MGVMKLHETNNLTSISDISRSYYTTDNDSKKYFRKLKSNPLTNISQVLQHLGS